MTHILLLGAGFSYNWGGWLASEVFEYLLGCEQIKNSPDLKELLWKYKDKGGFEVALSHVQSDYRQSSSETTQTKLSKLQDAIYAMFLDMDKGFRGIRSWEATNQIEIFLGKFLTKFDAIFTLNQDVLLERYYLKNVCTLSNRKWYDWQMPGMKPSQNSSNMYNEHDNIPQLSPLPSCNFNLEKNVQPYFKLHGSFNWQSTDDTQLLIIGGNKEASIASHEILKWYSEKFQYYLSQHPVKLMVIGYSFGDDHINKMLIDAQNNLQLFVIDPLGVDVLKQHNKTKGGVIYEESDLEKFLQPTLIGASRRPIRQIFGSDAIEHNKIMRFFE